MEHARNKLATAVRNDLLKSRQVIAGLSKDRLRLSRLLDSALIACADGDWFEDRTNDLIFTDELMQDLEAVESNMRREFEHRRALLCQLRQLVGSCNSH